IWWARDAGFDYEAAFEQIPEADGPVAPLVNLSSFAGKPRAEAEQALGASQACQVALHSTRCNYANRVEVVYIDGRADWITVSFPYGRYTLEPRTLGLLGLPVSEPQTVDASQSAWQMSWTGIKGLRSLQMVGDENGALFARIKVSHE
ncbi:MAG: hypothetical protein M3O62_06495, partial [Pseudomonadota bacterium]|nr:hypothetical protein [Pseudomonadota bacterium]